jgi:hypothetical protein
MRESPPVSLTFPRLYDLTTLIVTYAGNEYPVRLDLDEGVPFFNTSCEQPAVPDDVLELIYAADELGNVQSAIDRCVVALSDDSYVTRYGYRDVIS